MLVSCVLPTYNRAKFIPSAIRSFLSQTYSDLELIIVDTGTDETGSLIPQDPRIKYFHLDHNLICGVARNYGTERASGEIILNTDSDDWYSPERVERQVSFHVQSSKAVTGYTYVVLHDMVNDTFGRYTMRPPFLCGPTIIFSKSYWQNVDRIDDIDEPGEDWRFTQRAANVGQVARNADASITTCVARTHDGNSVPRDALYRCSGWQNEECPTNYNDRYFQ